VPTPIVAVNRSQEWTPTVRTGHHWRWWTLLRANRLVRLAPGRWWRAGVGGRWTDLFGASCPAARLAWQDGSV